MFGYGCVKVKQLPFGLNWIVLPYTSTSPISVGLPPSLTFLDVFNGDKVHVDHIVPWSKGGSTTIDNAQLVTAEANLKKSNKIEEDLPSLDEV